MYYGIAARTIMQLVLNGGAYTRQPIFIFLTHGPHLCLPHKHVWNNLTDMRMAPAHLGLDDKRPLRR